MLSANFPLSFSYETQREAPAAEPDGALVIRFPSKCDLEPWSLRVVERQVICGERSLDLARAPVMLQLFKVFCDSIEPVVRRETLLYLVYGRQQIMGCSERHLESKRANCIKMVSRARQLAAEHLSGPHDRLVEWFPYDRRTGTWCLIGMTREWERQVFSRR